MTRAFPLHNQNVTCFNMSGSNIQSKSDGLGLMFKTVIFQSTIRERDHVRQKAVFSMKF